MLFRPRRTARDRQGAAPAATRRRSRARKTKSCSKLWANPSREVDNNHRLVICSVRTRPIRSACNPAIQPPTAESSKVTVASGPAVVETASIAISVGITNPLIYTSMPSSAHALFRDGKLLIRAQAGVPACAACMLVNLAADYKL